MNNNLLRSKLLMILRGIENISVCNFLYPGLCNKHFDHLHGTKGPFKYYVSKEVGGLGQKMVIFADLQYYLC